MKEQKNGAQIACAIAGGQTALAQKLSERGKKISPQAISQWCTESGNVPAKAAVLVSEITGVPLHILNPEIFPSPRV